MNSIEAFVLQDPLIPEKDDSYTPPKLPKLVLFASPNDLLTVPTDTILASTASDGNVFRLAGTPGRPYRWSVKWGNGYLEHYDIPHSNILPDWFFFKLKIQGGDKLTLSIDDITRRVILEQINGRPVEICPSIYEQEEYYPHRPLPVETWGFHALRCFTIFGPLGLGFCGYYSAPGRAGKTSVTLELFESLLRLTRRLPNLFVIVLSIGERPKDANLYSKVQKLVDHDPERVEVYKAPVGKTSYAGQWQLFTYLVTQRVRALGRQYDVVILIDSLSRAAAAESSREDMSKDEKADGMLPGGMYKRSMDKCVSMVSLTGDYNLNSSISVMNVLLDAVSGEAVSAVAQIASQTSDNVPDVNWVGYRPVSVGYPGVDVEMTNSRRSWLFADIRQLQELKDLKQRMADEIKDEKKPGMQQAVQKTAKAQSYAQTHLIPPWVEDPPEKPLVPVHLSELDPSLLYQPRDTRDRE